MEQFDPSIAPESKTAAGQPATEEPASPQDPSEEARLFYLQGLNAGLLAELGLEHWPAVLSAPDDGTDGSCHLRHLRRLFQLHWLAEEEP